MMYVGLTQVNYIIDVFNSFSITVQVYDEDKYDKSGFTYTILFSRINKYFVGFVGSSKNTEYHQTNP